MATNFVRDCKSIFFVKSQPAKDKEFRTHLKSKSKSELSKQYWLSWWHHISQCLNKIPLEDLYKSCPFLEKYTLKSLSLHQNHLETPTQLVLNTLLNSTLMLKLIAYIHEIKVKEFVSWKKNLLWRRRKIGVFTAH